MSKLLNNNYIIDNVNEMHQHIKQVLSILRQRTSTELDAHLWFYAPHKKLKDSPRNLILDGHIDKVLTQLEEDYPSI